MRKWIGVIQEDFLGEKTMSSRVKWDENNVYKAGKGIDFLPVSCWRSVWTLSQL